MQTPQDPGPANLLSMGPIKVVEVMTPPAPSDREIADALGQDSVPFSEIRHLCSGKPLRRFDRFSQPDARA